MTRVLCHISEELVFLSIFRPFLPNRKLLHGNTIQTTCQVQSQQISRLLYIYFELFKRDTWNWCIYSLYWDWLVIKMLCFTCFGKNIIQDVRHSAWMLLVYINVVAFMNNMTDLLGYIMVVIICVVYTWLHAGFWFYVWWFCYKSSMRLDISWNMYKCLMQRVKTFFAEWYFNTDTSKPFYFQHIWFFHLKHYDKNT